MSYKWPGIEIGSQHYPGIIDDLGKEVESLDTGKVDKTSIVNNLTAGGAEVPLSAEQGKTLKGLVDGNSASISNLQTDKVNKDDVVNDLTVVTVDNTGSSDASDAINSAINFAYTNKKHVVFIPNGTYIIDKPIKPMTGIKILGESEFATILKVKDSTDIDCIRPDAGVFNIEISTLQIDGNKQNNSFSNGGNAINIWMDTSIISHVKTVNIKKHALCLNYDGSISDNQGYLNKILHNNFNDSEGEAIMWGWRTTDSWCCYNNIGSDGANIYIEGGTARFIGNHLDGNPEYNIYIPGGCDTMFFSENIIENAQKHCIYAPAASFPTAVRNTSFVNNIIRTASISESGSYDLINLSGYDADNKNHHLLISGNMMINPTSFKSKSCISLDYTQHASISNNIFSDYTDSNPINISANCTDCSDVNNVG